MMLVAAIIIVATAAVMVVAPAVAAKPAGFEIQKTAQGMVAYRIYTVDCENGLGVMSMRCRGMPETLVDQ